MSEITMISVQEKNKNRCNVYVDGSFSFAVSLDLAIKYGLKKGFVLDDNLLKEITIEDEKMRAYSLATKYLSRALKTKKQVITYLKGKEISEPVIYQVIDKLKEYGFINDEEYVKRYLEACSATQGKRLSDYKLMMKGIKKTDIESAREDVFVDGKENAKRIAERRLKNKDKTKENIVKTYRYLVGRGFSYEEAEYAVSNFKGEE